MQLMTDAITVLGSRHGLLFDPIHGETKIIRFDAFEESTPVEIQAGICVNGKKYFFPLCKESSRFAFFDQRMTPTSARWIAIEPETGLKISLSFHTPFRPRDPQFSVIPAIGIRLKAERISGNFRWTPVSQKVESISLFFEVKGATIQKKENSGDLDLFFESLPVKQKEKSAGSFTALPQQDRLVSLSGAWDGEGFRLSLDPEKITQNTLDLVWCTWSDSVLEVRGEKSPFKYKNQFASLDQVSAWAQKSGGDIFENSENVDAIIGKNNLSSSINHLLAQTLHSWLMNTWWVERSGEDWFSVWEGNCYFHSTVDVEFTQSPFYLAVWPELLGIELRQWTFFSKEGSLTLGDRARGSRFLSHDCGSMAVANGQAYHHEMEVEETTNYIILSYAYWRRTGDFSIVREKSSDLISYLQFLVDCDTTGTGIPDLGISNTIDDASPAIQFGREQVYLAVKTMASFSCGASMLIGLGEKELAKRYETLAEKIKNRIETNGWKDDHYVTLLSKEAHGLKNPWTGKPLTGDVVPGWDSAHIYTQNGLAVLDMVGWSSGLNPDRLKTDLYISAQRCLREYGCAHTDYIAEEYVLGGLQDGMVGVASNPGWISMNMLRDIAAFYRGIDFRHFADRYWEWQVTTNTQTPVMFFETFSGNNLALYPRGVAIWGFFDALMGRVVDRVAGTKEVSPVFPDIRVPFLLEVDWKREK